MLRIDRLAVDTLFTPEAARELVAQMNAEADDDWTYRVLDDPTGRGSSLVEIYDEDGEFIGRL